MTENETMLVLGIAVILLLVLFVTVGICVRIQRKKNRLPENQEMYIKHGVDLSKGEVKDEFSPDIDLIDRSSFSTICVIKSSKKRQKYSEKKVYEIQFLNLKTKESYRIAFRGEVLIGRGLQKDHKTAQFILKNPKVSKRHCRIREEKGKFYVYDENSLNHTYLNRVKVYKKTPIRNKDILTVGGCSFQIHIKCLSADS